MLVPSSNGGRDVEIGGTKLPLIPLISPLLKGGLGIKSFGKLLGPLPPTMTDGLAFWLDPYEFDNEAVEPSNEGEKDEMRPSLEKYVGFRPLGITTAS